MNKKKYYFDYVLKVFLKYYWNFNLYILKNSLYKNYILYYYFLIWIQLNIYYVLIINLFINILSALSILSLLIFLASLYLETTHVFVSLPLMSILGNLFLKIDLAIVGLKLYHQ